MEWSIGYQKNKYKKNKSKAINMLINKSKLLLYFFN